MKKIKVGIVGCGFIASTRHIPAFLKLKNTVNIAAVCDVNESLANSTAKKYNIPNSYSNIKNMLKKEDLDIVDICVPPSIHAIVALEAIEKNCNILLEKPMALTISDCDNIIKYANKYNVTLSVIHNEIFYPVIMKAEKLVKNGDIGDFIGMRWFRLTPKSEYLTTPNHWIHKLPGGIISETGPHGVYTSLRFIGNIKDSTIIAQKNTKYPWVLFDDYRIELEGDKGISSIMISHATNQLRAYIELIGTEGLLNIDLYKMSLIHYKLKSLKNTSLALSYISTINQTIKNLIKNTSYVIFNKLKYSHDIAIENFVTSILEEKTPFVSPYEGRETVRVINSLVKKLSIQYPQKKAERKIE